MANVVSVRASPATGYFQAGVTVTLIVDFDGVVDVDTIGGTPTLRLTTGGVATYASGSGASTLTFDYTVSEGENSADLDYASTSALVLNGATITDNTTLMPAVLNLPAPGTPASLGGYADIVVDTTAPTITGDLVAFSADSGFSTTDLITNNPSQMVHGTLTGPLGSGETVRVSLDNGASWTTATSAGNSWNLPTPVVLTGSNTLQVRVDDAAGNYGPVSSQAYVLDTTTPTTSVSSLAFSADTGISTSDFITKTAVQTISGTLSATLAADEEVQVSLNNGASWTNATATAGSNTWSLSGVTLVQSSTLQVRVADTAGNEGPRLVQAYEYDAVAPAAVSGLSLSNDTGASSSDFVTNVAAQTISAVLGSGLSAGDQVRGSLDNGATWIDITSKVSGSALTWNGVTLTASGVLRIQILDAAGNTSEAFTPYLVDTSAAAPSIPDLSAASDTGASSTDNITSDVTPTFIGTSEAHASVSLFDTDGTTVLGNAVADGSGNWSITSSTLSVGPHTVSAAITDLAGNTSTAGPGLLITIEAPVSPEPPAPSVVTIVTSSGSLITGDGGDNRIAWSGSGADTIAAGAGNDTLIAGPNNDVLQGATGADSISAGAGDDVVRGGQGDDFLNGNQGNDLVFGDLGDDTVAGGKGDDFVHGNTGDDVLLGDLGDDTVLGGQGDDILLGGDGADYLSGDRGDDVLIGGAGRDLFNFVDGAGRDVIADFSHAEGDQIRLSVTQAADFQALSDKMAMVGADTTITLDGLTIVLAGIPSNSLTADDFLFV